MATESPILPAEINDSFGSPRRMRRVSETETNRLLDLLRADDCIDEAQWIEVSSASNPLDELYSAALQQEATSTYEESEEEKYEETCKQVKKKRGKARVRRPKPYSSMSSTLKIPTPILPNLQADASLIRPLQYHQYQPATPTPSGTSSAK